MHDHHAIRPVGLNALQIHRRSAFGQITDIKYRIDINTGAHIAAKTVVDENRDPALSTSRCDLSAWPSRQIMTI